MALYLLPIDALTNGQAQSHSVIDAELGVHGLWWSNNSPASMLLFEARLEVPWCGTVVTGLGPVCSGDTTPALL